MKRSRVVWFAMATAALVLAACSATPATPSGGEPQYGGNITIATVAEPAGLDPALVLDNDSYRINAQMYETLVTLASGSPSEVVPGLAEKYSTSDGGRTWTFTLRTGVKFHDGTPFNADAVKVNFERWNGLPEQLQARAELYGAVFGGFGTKSNLESVQATDEQTVVVKLKSPRADFLVSLTLPVFGIASPTALQKYDANTISQTGSPFATEHPVGTGPFIFDTWVHGERVVLKRNNSYWGKRPYLDSVTFRAITDPSARLNAVQAGDVAIADLVSPLDIPSAKADPNLAVETRGSCNSGYVSFKSGQAPFNDVRVRQAVSHAIDKAAIVKRFYPNTGTPAWLLMPPSIKYYDDKLKDPGYDPDKARSLLSEAGQSSATVDFWYPTDVSRPWLPDARGIFEAIKANLEAVGFTVRPHSATWTTYLQESKTSKYGLFLLGWSCDYGSADNFYGGAFGYVGGQPNPRYDYESPEFEQALTAARSATSDTEAAAAWKSVQRTVYDDLPVVPFVHGSSALVLSRAVNGYVPNPVFVERLAEVWLSA